MPWTGWFSLGDSTKAPCFFGAELYKITECWRGKGALFALGGLVFVGRQHKRTVISRCKIIQNHGARAGKRVIFCPGWAGFRWGIAQKCYGFSMRNYIKLRSAAGEGGDFCPGWAGFCRENARNRPVSARNRPKTPRFRPVLARFCLTFAPWFAKMGLKKIHKNPPGGETKLCIFVYLCSGGAVLGPGNRMPGSGPFAKEKKG